MEQLTKRYIIQCTIGPVQQFIAQARKTRDLWFGSYLLSELAREAALTLHNLNSELIFPAAAQLEDDVQSTATKVGHISNKVVAVIHTNDPREVALTVRKAVNDKWRNYAHQVREKLDGSVHEEMWQRQVKDLLEFYAVWTAYPEGADYSVVRKRTEELMAARKTLRDFRANEPIRIFGDELSTLDSRRESVLHQEKYAQVARYGIKSNETLDAISLVKRMSRYVMQEREFKSVCDVAFEPYQPLLSTPKWKDALHEYGTVLNQWSNELDLSMMQHKGWDSHLFYDNRIAEWVDENLTKQVAASQKEHITASIRQGLEQFYTRVKLRPPSYYAFLMCDGDRIGRRLSSLRTIEEHQHFSESLSHFAKQVEHIVRKHQGQLVYSGGDDVMAYLPMTSCLEAVADLQQVFQHTLAQAFPQSLDTGDLPTSSVGIAIVHMIEPLGEARRLALAAEKQSKQNRNALTIHFQKRSGGDQLQFTDSFVHDPIAGLKKMQDLYEQGMFSARFAYELRSLYLEYEAMLAQSHDQSIYGGQLDLLLRQEVLRLARKKRASGWDTEQVESALEPLLARIQGENKEALEQLRQFAEQFIMAITWMKEGSVVEEDVAY
ncbi:type III-B CRISPR-associated protein Cas10/Cmr2 [Paenibacillus sp. UMB4589-SE434]|uniref:type III-B CRISPR-associated protein Cas10/Cmr2 n=1 Tax=Paenibacillus sp. UMB4589-SE434 TaxID=3046314 RepID=UPI00254E67A8|nr:type III-B CRISPR-associated protein Cas10/Cmr2 [Paenibacillus sp. UMB4589-SE434]MDK8180627.1 type III-B CRISPR-associated protein Cas10/Cmr2 [Paenibacillus sp. UMB4589-SE434]